MTSTDTRTHEWTKPGPGTWELDSSHIGPAPGPLVRDLLERGLEEGMAEGFALFGAPLAGMDLEWVNGKFYRRLVPLIGANREPVAMPGPLLWLGARLHPAFRRAERQARETFATRRWLSEIDRWEREWKPELMEVNRRLTRFDPTAATDGELADHVESLIAHLRRTIPLHFRLHVSDMGPLGNLMVHLDDWGVDGDDAFDALVAASPATRAPRDALRSIAAAAREAGVDPASVTSLDDVRAASVEAARLLEDYLDEHGWRLTAYDVEDRCLVELPEVVVASIRRAATVDPLDEEQRVGDGLATLRARVPEEHRSEFDELVSDARASYGLRDENGPLTYEWPVGVLRRALLEAGRRLAGSGVIGTARRVFELDGDEIVGALRGEPRIDAAEAERRASERRTWATLDAPSQLGPDEAPPPLGALPQGLRRATKVVLRVVAALEAGGDREPLHGLGIGDEAYVGTARVVRDAQDALSRCEPGDVIVAPYTAPTFNAVLAMAGGLVSEEGGLLCHAAVIARELQLPAVIGAAGACTEVPDGAAVEVDPVAGRVRVLD